MFGASGKTQLSDQGSPSHHLRLFSAGKGNVSATIIQAEKSILCFNPECV